MEITLKQDSLACFPNEKYYVAKSVCFEKPCRGIRLYFTHARGCNLVKITLDSPDGRCVAVVTCVAYRGEDVSVCDIETVSGTHDVYFHAEDRLQITEVAFTEENPYDNIAYTPVPEENLIDLQPESWEAEDMLGRRVKSAEDVKGKGEKQRRVGLFYWSWRDSQSGGRPVNVSKVLEEFPGAEYNINHPAWAGNHMCSWSEPLFGYYLNRDAYVIRRHAAMLAGAGVDVIVFDCTNGSLLWKDSYEPIFEGFRQARLDGIKTPQIAFMLNLFPTPGPFGNTERMIRGLYQDLYKPGRYSDLWFMLDGKPFVMAYQECIAREGVGEHDTKLLGEIHEFFAFRAGQPSYGFGPTRPDFWGWLEKAPQHKFGERPDGSCEMMTVGVAQNCNDWDLCTYFNNKKTYGRSYTHEHGHALLDETSYRYGYNFQEQWDRAIDCDPDFVFVTGWNEWIMGQWKEPWVKDPANPQIAFVDQFDREHSRDIEPDRDGIKDTYYLQLASNIRRYKGAVRRQKPSAQTSVTAFDQWDAVLPEYKNTKGTTIHRDCRGFGDTYYKNTTGRNDIILAKAARDSENLYFYAECAQDITPPAEQYWMTLFLDTDRSKATGWEGYDFAVNRSGNGIVEAYTPAGWKKIGEACCALAGNKLMLTIPRSLVGLEANGGGKKLNFEFKWSDNMQAEDIMDFYENGCAAPLGRFNYLFCE